MKVGFFRRAVEKAFPSIRRDREAKEEARFDRISRAIDVLDEVVQQPSRSVRPDQPPVARISRSSAIAQAADQNFPKAKQKRGFALMSKEKQLAASRKGGRASHEKKKAARS